MGGSVREDAGVIVLENNGLILLEENADVKLRSGGALGESGEYTLYLDGTLKTEKNAKLTIDGAKDGKQFGIYAPRKNTGIEADASSTMTINSVGLSNSSIYMGNYTYIDIKNEASINVNATRHEDSPASVIEMGAYVKLNVSNKGMLSAISDGSSPNHSILKGQSNTIVNIKGARYVNLQFTNSRLPNNARLINIASGTLFADEQDVQAWERKNINLNDRIADLQWAKMYGMQTQFTLTGIELATNGTSPNAAVAKDYLANFRMADFSRVVYASMAEFYINITNNPSDDVDSEDSTLIRGTTIPGAYVRVTGDDALPDPKIEGNVPGAMNPELTNKYTVIADADGQFTVNTKENTRFIASKTITVFAYKDGKRDTKTIVVRDKTAPTADGVTLTIVKGYSIPNAYSFLKNVKDTNPGNRSITHIYAQNYSYLVNRIGLHDVMMQIYDAADNTRNIPAKLNVVEVGYGIDVQDIKVNLSDLKKNKTDDQIIKYLLKESKAVAWGVENYDFVDYTGNLTVFNIPSIRGMKPGEYTMTASFDVSAMNPKAKATKYFNVTVLNDEAVSPTNPENPGSGSPSEQENPGTGQTGLLKLDYAPSTFDFGMVSYGFSAKDAHAVKTTSSKQWLQVSDNRVGENRTNWSVQVMENHPLQSATGDELKGATISVPQGKLYNQNTGDKVLISGISALTSKSVRITTSPSVIFTANQTKGKIQNISTDVWEVTDVKLHLPENQKYEKTDYSNTITWTLVVEPE